MRERASRRARELARSVSKPVLFLSLLFALWAQVASGEFAIRGAFLRGYGLTLHEGVLWLLLLALVAAAIFLTVTFMESRALRLRLEATLRQLASRVEDAEADRLRLRATIDTSLSPMVLLSPKLEVLSVNRAFKETFPDSLGEITGKSIAELAPLIAEVFADGGAKVGQLLQRANDAATVRVDEVRQVKPWRRDFVVQSSPVLDPAGHLLGRLIAFQDVTEEREKAQHQETIQGQLTAYSRGLEKELFTAADVQRLLLPTEVPQLEGLRVESAYRPARLVGGDFYDWWLPGPGLLNVVLGDVSGKGLPAAILMASVRSAVRAVAGDAGPGEILARATRVLHETLEQAERFVTMVVVQVDLKTKQVRCADAGHGLVLVRRGGLFLPLTWPRGLPLGIAQSEEFDETVVHLEAGDALVLLSDGLLEIGEPPFRDLKTFAAYCEEIGGIGALLASLRGSGLRADAATLGPANDDITMVVLESTVSPSQALIPARPSDASGLAARAA